MSIKSTLAVINAMPHVRARYVYYMGIGEYRVISEDSDGDEGVYYTHDADDAIGTARAFSSVSAAFRSRS